MRFKDVEDQLKGGGEIDDYVVSDLRQEHQLLVQALQQWTSAS